MIKTKQTPDQIYATSLLLEHVSNYKTSDFEKIVRSIANDLSDKTAKKMHQSYHENVIKRKKITVHYKEHEAVVMVLLITTYGEIIRNDLYRSGLDKLKNELHQLTT